MMRKKLITLITFINIGIALIVCSQKVNAGIEDFACTANHEISTRDGSMPLFLQKHPDWGEHQYGIDTVDPGEDKIKFNGCGLCSMAMVVSCLKGEHITPGKLAEVFQKEYPNVEDYYKDQVGTKWISFSLLASHFGFNVIELGKTDDHGNAKFEELDFQKLKEHLKLGNPVIISFRSSAKFNCRSHIMVLKQDNFGVVRMYDPNDSEDKCNYQKRINIEDDLKNDPQTIVTRLWAFSK